MQKAPKNPGVAAALDLFMYPLRKVRAEVVPAARGNVLELGAGTGANFGYYSAEVKRLTACEPDPYMRQRAEKKRALAPCEVRMDSAVAEDLPYRDSSFDSVVLTFTLCSVQDPPQVLAEALRVLRPGGRLLFAEHVVHPHRIGKGIQTQLNRPWGMVSGGCHLDRDALELIRQAGFQDVRHQPHGDQTWTFAPVISGVARRAQTER